MNKHTINVSHEFDVSAKDLFDRIRDGRLFKLAGADKIEFNFCEGGISFLKLKI